MLAGGDTSSRCASGGGSGIQGQIELWNKCSIRSFLPVELWSRTQWELMLVPWEWVLSSKEYVALEYNAYLLLLMELTFDSQNIKNVIQDKLDASQKVVS